MNLTKAFKFELHNVENRPEKLLMITFKIREDDYIFSEFVSTNKDIEAAIQKFLKRNLGRIQLPTYG